MSRLNFKDEKHLVSLGVLIFILISIPLTVILSQKSDEVGKPAKAAVAPYSVVGNKIVDNTGAQVVFRGIAKPSFEWSATGDGHTTLADYQIMASWGSKIIRLSLNQRFWLNNTSNYQQTLDASVNNIKAAGMDVILDLHWSDQANPSVTPAQQCMADSNSNLFWQQVANKYKGDPRVMFELYNEPHTVSWSVWKNGGSGCGFQVVGMQQLYNTVRATGAQNLVLIGGLNWAFDLSGVPNNRITGNNIVYVTHPYDFDGKNTVSDWDFGFGNLAATDPIIATEFGDFDCTTGFYTNLINYFESKKVGWTGWAWYVGGCGFPSLISDWNGTPNAPGGIVKTALLNAGGNPPLDTTSPTASITAPSNGATVSGSTVAVNANASDNVGVTRVEFYVDGAVKNTDTTSPYGFTWDSTTTPNGNHTLYAKAFDAANNSGTSTNISITVNNVSTPVSSIWCEAENATLVSPMVRVTDVAASNGSYINSTVTDSTNVPPTTTGSATLTVNITTAGTYTFWSRVNYSGEFQNSYYLQVDGGSTYYKMGNDNAGYSTWKWINWQNGETGASNKVTLNLTAGSHNLKIIGREANTFIDKILLTTDSTFAPTGTGLLANCGSTTRTGDMDGDGLVSILDLSYLLSKWGTNDSKADINKDGVVSVLDMSVLLANWG